MSNLVGAGVGTGKIEFPQGADPLDSGPSPTSSDQASIISSDSFDGTDLDEENKAAKTAQKTHQLVVFSKQLLVISIFILFAVVPASYFLGIGFWLAKDIAIVSATFGVAGLAALVSHKVQDFFESQERAVKKERKKQTSFLKSLEHLPIEELHLAQIEKSKEVRKLTKQPKCSLFNPLMQLFLNSDFLIQSLKNTENLKHLEDELSRLKKERKQYRRTQVIKTLRSVKKASQLKTAAAISESPPEMKECQRKIDVCKSKIHFLKAFNLFIQFYTQGEETDSRIIKTIIDSLGLSDMDSSALPDEFLIRAFDRMKSFLGDVEMDLVKVEDGSLDRKVFLINLTTGDLTGKTPQSILEDFFLSQWVLLEEAPQELFLKYNKTTVAVRLKEFELQEDTHLKSGNGTYHLDSLICEEKEGGYVSYIKKGDQWYSYSDENSEDVKKIDNIFAEIKKICILHYVL